MSIITIIQIQLIPNCSSQTKELSWQLTNEPDSDINDYNCTIPYMNTTTHENYKNDKEIKIYLEK